MIKPTRARSRRRHDHQANTRHPAIKADAGMAIRTSCAALSSALSSNSSRLRDLDLSENELQDSGVELLSIALQNQNCNLEKLQLEWCRITDTGFTDLVSALKSNPSSHLRELNLNRNFPGESGVTLLCDLLKHPMCNVEKLQLHRCNLTEEDCAVLSSNSFRLRELNLSDNRLRDSGVKLLSTALKNPNCNLEILRLSDCRITDEGFAALASALRSNPSSHLRELNLINNKPGESGVKLLSDLLKDPNCKLEKLDLCSGTSSSPTHDVLPLQVQSRCVPHQLQPHHTQTTTAGSNSLPPLVGWERSAAKDFPT